MENGKRILIVDDELSIRLTTSALLSMSGYEIDSASNGDEAMEKLDEFRPDLILLDILFPGKENGIDVCRRIKSDPKWSGVQIIMITAVGDKGTVIEVAKAGAAGYVVKPFNADTLKKKIAGVLETPASEPVAARKVRRGSGLAASRQAAESVEEGG